MPDYSQFDALHGNKPVKTYDDDTGCLTVELFGRVVLKVRHDDYLLRLGDFDTTVTRRVINKASEFFSLGFKLERRYGISYCLYNGQEVSYSAPGSQDIIVPRKRQTGSLGHDAGAIAAKPTKKRGQGEMAAPKKAMTAEERKQQLLVGELLRSANRFVGLVKQAKKGEISTDELVDAFDMDNGIQNSLIKQMRGSIKG